MRLYLQEWWDRRSALAAAGVKDLDELDDRLEAAGTDPRPRTREERSARIAALVAEAGG